MAVESTSKVDMTKIQSSMLIVLLTLKHYLLLEFAHKSKLNLFFCIILFYGAAAKSVSCSYNLYPYVIFFSSSCFHIHIKTL